MVDIVIEGPDNAGKSTLAELIRVATHRLVQPSEGPEKYPGEVNDRVIRYMADYGDIIYDRHPCVSQSIYSIVKANTPVNEELIKAFYDSKPLIIYCRPIGKGLDGHVIKPHDSPDFIESLETNYDKVVAEYDKWGLSHAAIIYRMGDDETRILNFIKGVIDYV